MAWFFCAVFASVAGFRRPRRLTQAYSSSEQNTITKHVTRKMSMLLRYEILGREFVKDDQGREGRSRSRKTVRVHSDSLARRHREVNDNGDANHIHVDVQGCLRSSKVKIVRGKLRDLGQRVRQGRSRSCKTVRVHSDTLARHHTEEYDSDGR